MIEGLIVMPRLIPPEIIDRIQKKEEEKHYDNRIPLYLPNDIPTSNDKEPEETSGVYIIDLIE
jgi:hypothetical protein